MHIIGIVFFYCIEQLCVWTLLHAIFLFWAVNFPFSYRQLRISRRMRYAHVISVLLGLIIPLPGPLLFLKDGYVGAFEFCSGRNAVLVHGMFAIPLSIFVGIAISLLMLTLWSIFKV